MPSSSPSSVEARAASLALGAHDLLEGSISWIRACSGSQGHGPPKLCFQALAQLLQPQFGAVAQQAAEEGERTMSPATTARVALGPRRSALRVGGDHSPTEGLAPKYQRLMKACFAIGLWGLRGGARLRRGVACQIVEGGPRPRK